MKTYTEQLETIEEVALAELKIFMSFYDTFQLTHDKYTTVYRVAPDRGVEIKVTTYYATLNITDLNVIELCDLLDTMKATALTTLTND